VRVQSARRTPQAFTVSRATRGSETKIKNMSMMTASATLDARVPDGPIDQKWTRCKQELKLIAPNNKRKYDVIVVGTGLAGASAAASLAELGYNVKAFCYQDTARRAHSIAAQGGINAAKNYPNDGDSVWRLFYDTIKGGDFRSREANVFRLAEVSGNIIDQCVAQGVPFAREYGGTLANRTFGGALVSRTFYCRGQTGQQLLLGAYSGLMRQVSLGRAVVFPRREMLDLVVVDGCARGIVCRNLVTGEIESHAAHAVLLCTGGYGNVFYLSTNAKGCNVTAAWRCFRRGAYFANPCFTQIHPTCIPVKGDYQSKLTLMSESLRNDGRVWVPRNPHDPRPPHEIPEADRDYYLERRYPSYGNMVPRDVASRAAKERCDQGYGVGESGKAVFLDFSRAIQEQGRATIERKYGNLFHMYQKITDDDPYRVPMRIYPAVHYTMGGLWVDYHLESTIPGLFVLGEANFSDHGANRLGASALMQGLADGYFVAPYTVGHHLATRSLKPVSTAHPKFKETMVEARNRIERILGVSGKRTVNDFHRQLGQIVWDHCGMARSASGLNTALGQIRSLRDEFWHNVRVLGSGEELNQSLEHAGRVADFLEFAELMVGDALHREESCGGHFREEHQTADNEALRHDDRFAYVAAWEHRGDAADAVLHKEPLEFHEVELTTRSYK
jgi:succinate dehydrogenase / fumarate reductase flavoprotein subunit